MKVFITLAVVCFVAATLATPVELNEEQQAKAKEIFDECVIQEKLTEEETTKLRNKDYANPSMNLKCFGTCFFEKVGTLKNNEIQEDVVLEKVTPILGEEKTKIALEKCRGIKGEDRCDTGFQIYQCFENFKAEQMAA
ncbi:general odorant-binding protein 56a-like [Haematobia irritans]|uniref:general odorant-binding protein 56a-like n=1 Tax=Haematobia irritans TaxID=7368 RepID=UPI003F4FB732